MCACRLQASRGRDARRNLGGGPEADRPKRALRRPDHVAVTTGRAVRHLGNAANPARMEAAMENSDQRIRSRMELALEEVCRQLSKSGGDHESRKYIAKQWIRAARAGKIGLEDLRAVAENALVDLTTRKSA